jgi:hypothetical protein
VYRTRDSRLGRDVAIKVLPKVFASDPDRLKRFEREARLLAALNHPQIAAIYGLVLELVEGPTLAERLAAGPLPVNEAVTIARKIAEALQAAHEKGIIHRDLKPGKHQDHDAIDRARADAESVSERLTMNDEERGFVWIETNRFAHICRRSLTGRMRTLGSTRR